MSPGEKHGKRKVLVNDPVYDNFSFPSDTCIRKIKSFQSSFLVYSYCAFNLDYISPDLSFIEIITILEKIFFILPRLEREKLERERLKLERAERKQADIFNG